MLKAKEHLPRSGIGHSGRRHNGFCHELRADWLRAIVNLSRHAPPLDLNLVDSSDWSTCHRKFTLIGSERKGLVNIFKL